MFLSDDKSNIYFPNQQIEKLEFVLKNYNSDKEEETHDSQKEFYTEANLELLKKYFKEMPDTQFVFFCSPFSVLYWKEKYDNKQLNEYKLEFEKTFEFMSRYDNVTVYFWTDDEMLEIISDLDNYKDSTHYGVHISKEIIRRMGDNIGLLPKERENWQPLLDKYFNYLENFDYETIFN